MKRKIAKLFSSTIRYLGNSFIQPITEKYEIYKIRFFNEKKLHDLRNKECIKCVFFVSDIADWKCEHVFKLMLENKRFSPSILITPAANYEHDMSILKQRQCVDYFKSKKYNYTVAYDEQNHSYLDVKKDINPDIVVYTCPYKSTTDKRYFISSNRDSLGIYIPYGFTNNKNLDYQYDLLLHNLVWRYYLESDDHLTYFKNASRCKGRSGIVTGYPGIESLITAHNSLSYESWKDQNKNIKRIIWAPHHTIEGEGVVVYSCFLDYADFMVQMAKKYIGSVQFAFKPHPLLRPKLNNLWGKEKTDAYYKCWEDMPNSSLCEGEYVDLFLTSDAMIHDSGSFITEYLYVNKPVLRTINDIPLSSMYNSFTLKSLNQYYLARNTKDVEQFIENIIKGIDPLKEQRTTFINEVLMPQKSPSQSIVDNILDSIDNQILYYN